MRQWTCSGRLEYLSKRECYSGEIFDCDLQVWIHSESVVLLTPDDVWYWFPIIKWIMCLYFSGRKIFSCVSWPESSLVQLRKSSADRTEVTLQTSCLLLKHQDNILTGVDRTCKLHATFQLHHVKHLPRPYSKLRPEVKDQKSQQKSTQ